MSWEENEDPSQPTAQGTTMASPPTSHISVPWEGKVCTGLGALRCLRGAGALAKPGTGQGSFRGHLPSLGTVSLS